MIVRVKPAHSKKGHMAAGLMSMGLGRARRTGFWTFALINTLIGFVLSFAEIVFETAPIISTVYYWFILTPPGLLWSDVCMIAGEQGGGFSQV